MTYREIAELLGCDADEARDHVVLRSLDRKLIGIASPARSSMLFGWPSSMRQFKMLTAHLIKTSAICKKFMPR